MNKLNDASEDTKPELNLPAYFERRKMKRDLAALKRRALFLEDRLKAFTDTSDQNNQFDRRELSAIKNVTAYVRSHFFGDETEAPEPENLDEARLRMVALNFLKAEGWEPVEGADVLTSDNPRARNAVARARRVIDNRFTGRV